MFTSKKQNIVKVVHHVTVSLLKPYNMYYIYVYSEKCYANEFEFVW